MNTLKEEVSLDSLTKKYEVFTEVLKLLKEFEEHPSKYKLNKIQSCVKDLSNLQVLFEGLNQKLEKSLYTLKFMHNDENNEEISKD